MIFHRPVEAGQTVHEVFGPHEVNWTPLFLISALVLTALTVESQCMWVLKIRLSGQSLSNSLRGHFGKSKARGLFFCWGTNEIFLLL